MGVYSERFRQGDVFIDYDFEGVMFRYDFGTNRFFRKFYDDPREDEVLHDNGLLNEAIRFGDETDAKTYQKGKVPTQP